MEKPAQMSDFTHNGGVITVGKMSALKKRCGCMPGEYGILLRNVWIVGRHRWS